MAAMDAVPRVEFSPTTTLPEMISAIAAGDWGGTVSGEECLFLWGRVEAGPGLAPLRLVTKTTQTGQIEVSGWVVCDEQAANRALPPGSGVIMEWRGDALRLAHASDLHTGSVFDSDSQRRLAADTQARSSYVLVVVSGNEKTLAATALARFPAVIDSFGAAVLPVGAHPNRGTRNPPSSNVRR